MVAYNVISTILGSSSIFLKVPNIFIWEYEK